MDDKHEGVQGYLYESSACLSCHPDGTKGNAFNHGNSNFPLTGAHTSLNCQECHASGYSGTPIECLACHEDDFVATTNPNHTQLGISTECTTCHSTEPGWQPALFPTHNQYFELLGRHLEIANDCGTCHNGNYNNTPNLCFDCHTDAYNNALNPNHTAAGISTLYQDYETGDIDSMVYRDNFGDPWAFASYPDDHWVPDDFAMCLGTYSFIWAGQDWALTHLGGAINRTFHEHGLSTVETYLGGVHAFDFRFSQKPEYTLTNRSSVETGTYNVSYECLDVVSDSEFIGLVSGMTELVGEFGRLIVGYAINQTNTFTHGIPFEDAYNQTDPQNMAAFFVTCYPEYGAYGGGAISHDPVFVMYFSVSGAIPGFPMFFLLSFFIVAVSIVIYKLKKGRF